MIECFTTYANKIEGRIDPHFYRPAFIKIDRKIKGLVFKKLREISLDLKNGSTPAGGVFEKEGIPYFRSQDFNLFDFRINQFISLEFHKQLMRSATKPGDVLIAVVGATLGVIGYVSKEIKEGNINQNVARVRVIDKNVNPKYLAIFLASDLGQELTFRAATITTQAYLNNQQLGDIEVPFPSIDIQNNIIQIMEGAYKTKKEKETEAKQLLDLINDYVLDELGIKFSPIMEDKIYCINSEELENNRNDPYYFNPKFKRLLADLDKCKIKLTKIDDVAKKVFNGKTPAKEDYAEKGNFILKVSCLKNSKIEWDKLSFVKGTIPLVKTVNDKDILLLSSAHQSEYLGKNPSIVVMPNNLKDKKIYFVGELINIRADTEKINPYYLLAILKLHEYYLFVNREKRGQTSHLYPADLGKVKIPLPSLLIQNKIADEVKRRMQKAKQLQKEAKEELEKAKQEVEKIILGEWKATIIFQLN